MKNNNVRAAVVFVLGLLLTALLVDLALAISFGTALLLAFAGLVVVVTGTEAHNRLAASSATRVDNRPVV